MWKLWRLYLKVSPTLDEMEKLTQMKLSTNVIFQFVALAAQLANQALPLVPPNAQKYVLAALTAAQALASIRAHFSNPDGTPAQVAYVPAGK